MNYTSVKGVEKPAPTVDYILNRLQELKTLHLDDDTKLKRIRELREMQREVVLPVGKKFVDAEVRMPDIDDEIQRTVATVTLNGPKFKVTPTKEGVQKDMDNADMRERHAKSVLIEAGRTQDGSEETFYAM